MVKVEAAISLGLLCSCRGEPRAPGCPFEAGLAIELLGWSENVVLCLDARDELGSDDGERLARNGIHVREERIERVIGAVDGEHVERIEFVEGAPLACRALFFHGPRRQPSDLALQLGCSAFDDEGCHTGKRGRTNVHGLYIVGDASRDVLQVAVAVGEGCETAIALNAELLREQFG